MKKQILSAAIVAVVLTGCASQEQGQNTEKAETNVANYNTDIAEWVLNPSSANGFAASNCVNSSGNFSIDRNHAVSLARNTLAQNMSLKANVLEKTYQKMDSASGVTTTGSSFEQVAKQITSISVQNSQVEKVALVTLGGVDQICALVTMPKFESEKLFNNMVGTSTTPVDPTDKAELYKEFISQKTAKELESQIKSLSEATPAATPAS